MKYVKVPPNIQITIKGEPWKESDGSNMAPWPIARYLEDVVLPDPSIGTTYKALKACMTMADQFKDIKPGTYVAVEDDHWELLNNAILEPKGGGIPSTILRQFMPFMDAVINARDTKPEVSDSDDPKRWRELQVENATANAKT